jgi:4-hydroxybenzoate polyprenyltransferase
MADRIDPSSGSAILVFFRLIRLPNLLIVGLTQYLLHNFVLVRAFDVFDIPPALSGWSFFGLVLATMIVAAAGYVINDLLDVEIDRINKPHKQFIGTYFSVKTGWMIYWSLHIAGLIPVVYLASTTGNWPAALLYPFTFLFLWLYSRTFKKSLLIGNVLVAFFCAGVAGLVWYAEREGFALLWQMDFLLALKVASLFSGYLLFAYFSTLYRELIKDLEDLEGDREAGCNTAPIAWGVPKAKGLAVFWACCLIVSVVLLMWQWVYQSHWLLLAGVGLGVIVPILWSLVWLFGAKEKREYHRLSQLAKWIMLSGLLLIPLFQL